MASKQSFLFLLILAAFLYVESLSRPEIIDQYQITLQRFANDCEQKYFESTQKFDLLFNESVKNLEKIMNRTLNRIDLLKTTLSDAINLNSGEIHVCLRKLENETEHLTTSPLNNCINYQSFSTLDGIKAKFIIMANVSRSTIGNCQNLNPLDGQDESFKKCLVDKIVDINEQIYIIEEEFGEQNNYTLTSTMGCLTQEAGNIFSKIGAINYGINVCIFSLNKA